MAKNARPYFIRVAGVDRLVEGGNSPAVVVAHVLQQQVEDIHPASGAEVAAWYKAGKPIDIIGNPLVQFDQKPASEVKSEEPAEEQPDDDYELVRKWLIDHGLSPTGASFFGAARLMSELTGVQLAELSREVPAFGKAICYNGPVGDPTPLVEMVELLNKEPMPFDIAMGLAKYERDQEIARAEHA